MDFLGLYPDLGSAQDAVRRAVQAASGGHINLVTQGHEVLWVPPMRAISIRRFDLSGDGDLYKIGGRKGIGRQFIETLAQAARIDVLSTERVDDKTEPCVASFKVVVKVPLLDGGFRMVTGDKTIDLRDGSPGAGDALGRSNSTNNLAQARKFIYEICATKARLRAYREALGMVSGGDQRELTRPWVVISLAPHFDVSLVSQHVIDAAAAEALGVAGLLYGTSAPPMVAPEAPPHDPVTGEVYDGDPRPQGSPPAAQQEQPGPQEPAPVAPDVERASRSQLEELGRFHKQLEATAGGMFSLKGGAALGRDMPRGKDLLAVDADIILAALTSEFGSVRSIEETHGF